MSKNKDSSKKRVTGERKDELKLHVLFTISMRFTIKESLAYLASRGYELQENRYYVLKREIEKHRDKRAFEIAKYGFLERHIKIIENLETVEHEYWIRYNKEKDHFKASLILSKIVELQPYLSQSHDYTRKIIEKQTELKVLADNSKVSKSD